LKSIILTVKPEVKKGLWFLNVGTTLKISFVN
jgi:hypothetical protein